MKTTPSTLAFLEFSGILRVKLLTPLKNGFRGDDDTSSYEKFFHPTKTEAEPMVQPDGMADKFRGITVILVAGWLNLHYTSQPKAG